MLDALQATLETRFGALADRRRAVGYPVYGIEHGLDPQEVESLRSTASERLSLTGPNERHWLVWIVLASEAGYRYGGEEYWPSLEVRRGEWASGSDRAQLRHWHKRFATKFGGPRPVGRWAEHFSIIAWPIANAVLPRYLQNHFARHLYELRHQLAEAANGSLDELGCLLRDRLRERNTRFADFLQQTDLTARIVLAIRDEDLEEQVARLEPEVLGRFVTDLEERREARTFLREARRVIRDGRWKLVPRLRRSEAASVGAGSAPAPPRAPTSMRLGASVGASGELSLGVIVPPLEQTLIRAGIEPSDLSVFRVSFDAEQGRWSPALALIGFAGQVRPLARFPDQDAPAFPFDGPTGPCGDLLAETLRIEEKPVWLLRRHRDGLHREVRGRAVNAADDYVLLCRAEPPPSAMAALRARPLSASVAGIIAYRFGPLGAVSPSQGLALETLGLGYRLAAQLKPAGLLPRPGDVPTWTVGEPVAVHVSADFDVAEFLFELDDGRRLRTAGREGGFLLEIGALEVGRHTLRAVAVPQCGLIHDIEPATLEFEVRPPRPWMATVSETAGFRIFVHPDGAALEDLLAGRAEIIIYSALERRLHWSALFVDSVGLAGKPVSLGEASDQAAIARLLRRLEQECSDEIDDACRIDLIASAGELGRQVMRFPHTLEPIRWRFERASQTVRLIDESGHEEPLVLQRYPLTAPATPSPIDPAEATQGVQITPPGAMFCAGYGDGVYATLVSAPAPKLSSLEELGLSQTVSLKGAVPTKLQSLLGALRAWRDARPNGPMALVRKLKTIDTLKAQIGRVLCGADWYDRLQAAGSDDELRALQEEVLGRASGFASLMRSHPWPAEVDTAARARFFELANRYRVSRESDLCQAALTAAWAVQDLPCRGEEATQLWLRLLDARPLLRGAFMAHASARLARTPEGAAR